MYALFECSCIWLLLYDSASQRYLMARLHTDQEARMLFQTHYHKCHKLYIFLLFIYLSIYLSLYIF